jgi:PAS domain S-box-containing protein
VVAVVIAGSFRLYQGGAGGIVGTVVIVVTACVGLAWRFWKEKHNKSLDWKQLYAFGILVQLAMLSCMILMPADMRIPIIKAVAPPILIIFPIITLLIGHILKRQEERRHVREAFHQYEIIVSSSTDMMALMDKDYKFVAANKSYLNAFQLKQEELIGKTAANVLGEEFFNTSVKPHAERCLGGEKVNFQNWTNLPAYGRRYVDINYSPYYDVNNEISGYVVVGRDITERKQTKNALHESYGRFKALFENAPIPYQSLDENGIILEVNQTWLNHFGYTKNEVIGKSIGDFLPAEWQEHFKENFPRFKDLGEVLGVEFELLKKDGSLVLMSVNGKIGKNLDGSFKQTHCVLHDITEHRRLEEQLRQSQKMEAIGTMAGGIAHDFNNILTIINGNAEIAKDDIPVESPARENIEEIQKASNRAKDLVSQILTFSRKERKELIPIRPQSMIKETMKFLRSTTPTTISILQNISEDCGMIKADPTGLHQVLMNLFTNAVHAINEKGEVSVSLQEIKLDSNNYNEIMSSTKFFSIKKPGTYMRLSVTDKGAGMDSKTVTRIFDPFYTTKEVGKGTGMGLSVVHGIVESHEGFIDVDSVPGKGSTFHVYFPVTEEEEPLEADATTPPQRGMERILLIDDEESLLRLGKRMLEGLGYEVTAEMSSVKAFEIFKSAPEQFDLIITDQAMPNMSGSEFIAEIVKVRPGMPIILCTGYSSKISEVNAKEKGINKFINKPYSKKNLSESIREVLSGQS